MLNKMINGYVELYRSMGFKYKNQSYLLQLFAAFAKQQGDTYVRCKTVLEWAKQAPSRAQRRNRLLTVRRFSIAMQSEDKRYEIPPPDAFGNETLRRRIPRILSSLELKQLLIAASKLKPENSIRPLTYATLFALLASTGLRISEALALNLESITEDGLIILSTKFRKDRLVPLHPSTRKGIEHYLNYRRQIGGNALSLFVSNNGSRLSYSTVNSIFLQLVRSIGLRDGPGHPGICIHDLRHRFAVTSLEQSKNDRVSISQHMTALSTYLGHAHISDTYWYLHATPTLMEKISIIQETFYRSNINEQSR
jgi:integrase